jgi:3-oxoadipate enol-lactonase
MTIFDFGFWILDLGGGNPKSKIQNLKLLASGVALLAAACATTKEPLFITGPQGRIHSYDAGTGPSLPVVFVHGNGGSLTQWRGQLEHLQKTRRVIALDLRGMGLSQVPANGDYSVEAMADDVHAVVEARRIPRFVLVGHSYGGTVVAAYAAKHAARVAGLVFADAAGDVKFSDDVVERFLESLRVDKASVVRQWWAPILQNATEQTRFSVLSSADRTPTETIAAALEGVLKFSMTRALQSYGGQKLAIAAGEGTPVSLHVQFPDIPMKRMEQVSHWLMMDRPVEFNSLLDDFLKALDSAGDQHAQ